MAVDATLTVVGVKDALRELNNIDKVARREITRDYKKVVAQVVSDAQGAIPVNEVMSGWNRKWTTKSGFQMFPIQYVDDKVTAGVSGKKPKQFGGFMQNLATFYVKFSGPHTALLDMGGRGKVPTDRGKHMVAVMTARMGRRPSRILWPAYENNSETVQAEVQKLVDRVMLYVSQGIAGATERRKARG